MTYIKRNNEATVRRQISDALTSLETTVADHETRITALEGSGGGGGADVKQVEQDLGLKAVWRGRFTIVDAAISPTSHVAIWQAPGPYTGKGTLADEAEMDPIWCVAYPGSGSATVYWRTLLGAMPTPQLMDAGRANTTNATVSQSMPYQNYTMTVRGRVKGNFKFNYLIG
jgi:hypothetical protein